MLRKEEKDQIIEANRTHEHDTGSPEVQIAILTKRINDLHNNVPGSRHLFSFSTLLILPNLSYALLTLSQIFCPFISDF